MNVLGKLKKIICFCFFALLSTKAFSALPPLPQSIKEIEAILSSDFMKSSEMTPETIWQIQKTERGYILETNHFIIPIEIIQLPQENIGPAPFEVQFDLDKLISKE